MKRVKRTARARATATAAPEPAGSAAARGQAKPRLSRRRDSGPLHRRAARQRHDAKTMILSQHNAMINDISCDGTQHHNTPSRGRLEVGVDDALKRL